MTIDELHNKMANLYGYEGKLPMYINDAVDMLRQQQAEIEAMKTMLGLNDYTFTFKIDLTDEEIEELANKYLYVLNSVPYANDIKDFAKALLKKASEK
jgi:hypothetical protein